MQVNKTLIFLLTSNKLQNNDHIMSITALLHCCHKKCKILLRPDAMLLVFFCYAWL